MNGYRLVWFLLLVPFFAFPQEDAAEFGLRIYYGSENNIVHYCSDSTAVAPEIIIEGEGFDEESEGLRISVANYRVNEDLLVYYGPFRSNWNQNLGYLEIMGPGTAEEYEKAVRQVFYKNIKGVPELGPRNISITLNDADYLPATKHFYRFIPRTDISWSEARDSAQSMIYYGLQGYLTTITSAVENDFIWLKVRGVGWIGATDELVEGRWVWATGPEAGTQFWQNNYPNGYAVGGMYANWSEGEPNNSHVEINSAGEDYGHINQNPSKRQKTWNDLRLRGDGPTSQYYRPQGFVVEFGGMPGDPVLQLSATTVVMIDKSPISDEREFRICQGDHLRLNELPVNDLSRYEYSWSPAQHISSTSEASPVVSPNETSIYHVSGKYGTCETKADFKVEVKPRPVLIWEPVYYACGGEQITIDPGEHDSYLWDNGSVERIRTLNREGFVSLKVTNEHSCSLIDSVWVEVTDKPILNLDEGDTLVCGSKQNRLDLQFDSDVQVLMQPLQPGLSIEGDSTLSPLIAVDQFGNYNIDLEIKDLHGCIFSDTLTVGFHNQPVADFFIDSLQCRGYNLTLTYEGENYEPTEFTWYSNDTVFMQGMDLDSLEIPLGYGLRQRSVGLKVNEKGCKDESIESIHVTPEIDFGIANDAEGCSPLTVLFENTASEEIESWFWEFGDGSFDDMPDAQHIYVNSDSTAKIFSPSLQVISLEGCSNTGRLENGVTVFPVPKVDFNLSETDCMESEAEIYFKGKLDSGYIYNWDLTNLATHEILNNPAQRAGPLVLDLHDDPEAKVGLQVISQKGCASDMIYRNFRNNPAFTVEIDNREGCPPLTASFLAEKKILNDEVEYSWNYGDGNFGNGSETTHTYLLDDTQPMLTVTAKSLVTGCMDTMVLDNEIMIYAMPRAGFSADPQAVLISNPRIWFTNESMGAESYIWDFDDSRTSTEENPAHDFREMGIYRVKLNAFNEFGCVDTIMQEVAVGFDKIFPPNAFSPNSAIPGDREFRIHSAGINQDGYRLQIYNRWGQVIFESLSQEDGWDGRMGNGNFAPAGVYPWVLQFTDFMGKVHSQQGTVTLLF